MLSAAIAAGCATTPPSGESTALSSLVAAERAFARMSVDQGIRAAFVANFADDGVNFQPGPVNTRRAFAARPPPPNPKAVTLDWTPVAAGVAHSGDFGYTTGPYLLTDNLRETPPLHGVYFSIWKRDAAGTWRVAVDAGISTPGPVALAALLPAPGIRAGGGGADAGRRAPAEGEKSPITAGDYSAWFAADGRLQRNDRAPIIGQDAIRAHFAALRAELTFAAQDAAVAPTGDLAYTFGALSVQPAASGLRSGWYVHLWARDARGDWRIIVATLLESADGS